MTLPHICHTRVYYRDTDKGGVVYYGRYAEYLEIGRTEFLRDAGFPASKIEREYQIICPVTDLTIKYLRPAHYDEELRIQTILTAMSAVRIYFSYLITDSKDMKVCEGSTVNCSVNIKSLRPVRFPEGIVKGLHQFIRVS